VSRWVGLGGWRGGEPMVVAASRAHGDDMSESWRKGTWWGWARWAMVFNMAEKVSGLECR
jgi:hypothetical protein